MQSVRFGWPKAGHRLIEIDEFELAQGATAMLSGPSGSGKSTLLSLVAGVVVADSGEVRVLDQDLSSLGSRERDRFRADHMGIIFQQFNLVPYLSALDNVLLACQFSSRRRQQISDAGSTPRAEAHRLLGELELDQPESQNRAAVELSIGQQQRVAAARALIGAPSLVIADEPTSALDDSARARFLDLLFTQCRQHQSALLFVTHDQRLTSLFDQAIALSDINRAQVPSQVL